MIYADNRESSVQKYITDLMKHRFDNNMDDYLRRRLFKL